MPQPSKNENITIQTTSRMAWGVRFYDWFYHRGILLLYQVSTINLRGTWYTGNDERTIDRCRRSSEDLSADGRPTKYLKTMTGEKIMERK